MGDFRPHRKDWLQLTLLVAILVGVVYTLDRFVGRTVALVVGIPCGLILAGILLLFLVAGPQPRPSKVEGANERPKVGR
ncbi:MAG: hypothetical protein AABX89_06680 [Candidatus Thermoplasmatota archaeon]